MAPESTEPPALARRSVLRTAAHAAWAVPAISVVAAAPAFADSHETVPFGTFSMDPYGWDVEISNFSLTYSPEPWSAGDILLTVTTSDGSPLDAHEWGDWHLTNHSMPLRFVYSQPLTSGVPFGGTIRLWPMGGMHGMIITATLENVARTAMYAQRTLPWDGAGIP